MKKYLVEFIGTFFLVFTIGMAVRSGTPFAPFAIGGVLMVMIFAGGHVSGAHFNPAVTLAVFIRGKCEAKDLVPYMAAQLAAGVTGALLVLALHGPAAGRPCPPWHRAFGHRRIPVHLRARLGGAEYRDP